MLVKLRVTDPSPQIHVQKRKPTIRCEICSNVTTKTPERRHWRRSVSIVNFEQVNIGWDSVTQCTAVKLKINISKMIANKFLASQEAST